MIYSLMHPSRTLNFNGTYESITFWTVQTSNVSLETSIMSSYTPLSFYPNSFLHFNLIIFRTKMVNLQTISVILAVRANSMYTAAVIIQRDPRVKPKPQ